MRSGTDASNLPGIFNLPSACLMAISHALAAEKKSSLLRDSTRRRARPEKRSGAASIQSQACVSRRTRTLEVSQKVIGERRIEVCRDLNPPAFRAQYPFVLVGAERDQARNGLVAFGDHDFLACGDSPQQL